MTPDETSPPAESSEPTTTPALFLPPPAHPFVDDPGGVFTTDAHRRVLGNLPTPSEPRTSRDLLHQRIAKDGGNPLAEEADIDRILAELVAEGHVAADNGLRMTEAGLEAICR